MSEIITPCLYGRIGGLGMKIKCWLNRHQWFYWHTEEDTPKERVFRRCRNCGKTQQEIWTGFAEYYWCPAGYGKGLHL